MTLLATRSLPAGFRWIAVAALVAALSAAASGTRALAANAKAAFAPGDAEVLADRPLVSVSLGRSMAASAANRSATVVCPPLSCSNRQTASGRSAPSSV